MGGGGGGDNCSDSKLIVKKSGGSHGYICMPTLDTWYGLFTASVFAGKGTFELQRHCRGVAYAIKSEIGWV